MTKQERPVQMNAEPLAVCRDDLVYWDYIATMVLK